MARAELKRFAPVRYDLSITSGGRTTRLRGVCVSAQVRVYNDEIPLPGFPPGKMNLDLHLDELTEEE